ncbi:MAG: VanZ family protein [Steroidobacteraceae bacterium]
MSRLPLRYRLAWIASIWLLVVLIVTGSLVPDLGPLSIAGSDKYEHFTAYFTLSLLCSAVVTADRLLWVMAAVLILGMSLEAAQALLTVTRTGDWADVLANASGILAAWLLVRRRAGWALAVEAWLAGLRRH